MPTANHVLLRRITLTASASSVTFDSIPQTGYTDLKIVMSARGDASDGGAAQLSMLISINGSTTGSHKFIGGNGSSAFSSGSGSLLWNYMNANTSTANTFSNSEFYFPNYNSTTQYKSYSIDSVVENNATGGMATLDAGLVSSNFAITTIGFTANTGNFVAGSSFSLYGIANAATTPALAPKADGGDIIKTDGTYWYHTFTNSGIFRPQVGLTCDYLVVAGGAAGSVNVGGGGGAGGYLTGTVALASSTNFVATIGAGGTKNTYPTQGTNGSNSVFSSFTAIGGGTGAVGGVTNTAASGGSGGGGGSNSTPLTGGAGTSGQGFAGGNGSGGGGGGGGATQAGAAGTSSTAGKGGDGITSSISGTSTTYAGGGGGGGGTSNNYTVGAGGSGGGTAGGAGYDATNAAANTGAGGGGGGVNSANSVGYAAGNGGSGIIIIRYTV